MGDLAIEVREAYGIRSLADLEEKYHSKVMNMIRERKKAITDWKSNGQKRDTN